MMRFVDLGKQLGIDEEWPREFCFFSTVSDQFLNFNGDQVWKNWAAFEASLRAEIRVPDDAEKMLERLRELCPDWVFSATMPVGG
jgi:hypothetical protein